MCKELNEFKNTVASLGKNKKALEDKEVMNRVAKRVVTKIHGLIIPKDKLKGMVTRALSGTKIDYEDHELDDLAWIAISAVFKHLDKSFGITKKDEIKLRDQIFKNMV